MAGSDPDVEAPHRERRIGSCPLDCPDACSWVVTVEHGRAVRLRGNPEHPFTRGGLCKKVNPWLRHAADPSRLLHPLVRVGAKGEGRFEPVSWDDAIALLADRLTTVIDRDGPEAIWPFVGTGNIGLIQGSGGAGARLWNAIGASRHQISICSVSGWAGLSYTTGSGATVDPEEVVRAGTVLLWGANPLVTHQHLWPLVERAGARGAEIVTIDPVTTRTAARSDRHLALRPGTDGALALGLARAVLDRGGVDEAYLAGATAGWSEFARSLDGWSPERAAETCGIERTEVLDLADLLVDRGPLFIKLGQGMQRHAGGGQAARAVSCLPALTGDYGRPGGGLAYSTSGTFGLDTGAATRPDLRPHAGRYLAMTHLGRNLTELEDPPVRALVVVGANPVVSNPQTGLVRRGLARDDLFTTVIDCFPTETVAHADLVLPSTLQHEQVEMTGSFGHLYLNWNEPATEPAGECLPHTEIMRRLAAALGRTEPELFVTDTELAEALLSADRYRAAGITLDVLRRRGFVPVPEPDLVRSTGRFATPSGRFEFASERAEREGHGRLPHYRPPIEAARSRSPGRYALVATGHDLHVNSVFAGTAVTRQRHGTASRHGRPIVTVHPEDAAADGLKAGQAVVVGNERGRFTAVVAVDVTTRPGVAATEKGAWATGLNTTVAERDSDMGRGAVYHDNAVTIRPAG
jgi:anaerobic selenocysteine-containing dehydrogenase